MNMSELKAYYERSFAIMVDMGVPMDKIKKSLELYPDDRQKAINWVFNS